MLQRNKPTHSTFIYATPCEQQRTYNRADVPAHLQTKSAQLRRTAAQLRIEPGANSCARSA